MAAESEDRILSDTSVFLVFICLILLVFSIASFTLLQNQWNLNSELQERLERSQSKQTQSFWFFYYSKPKKQSFGIDELREALHTFNWSLRYRAWEFDCSEMSAFLERYLENQGWNTSIAVGFEHAWLIVETTEGNYTPVEAQHLEIIYSDNEEYDNYFKYDYLLKNIYSAQDFAHDEFNWWIPYGLYTDPDWKEIDV